ncbi:MAG TPA: sugar-binding protein [Bacteroidales bacterium]|nr:sugar-binding protein [Bacteroidales bacterium]
MKKIFIALPLLAMSFFVFGQNDSIVLADYETNSVYPARTYGWNDNWGLTIGVDNPTKDAVNPSEKVSSIHLTNQWGHAIVLNNFDEPVSLAMYPNVKLKVLSDSAVSKKVGINIIDVNDFAVYAEVTLPADVNSKWANVVVNFAEKVTSTPVSFISKIEIYIDRGTGDPAVGNKHNKYFVDDIRFTGPKANITETDMVTLFQESFSDNAWWMSEDYDGCKSSGYKKLEDMRSIQWGGSALTAQSKFYNSTDSLLMVMVDWNGKGVAELRPFASRPGLSSLVLKDIAIAGMKNMKLKYNLRWKEAPASYSLAPTVEYKVDGGNWAAVTTSSILPSGTGTWANDIEYDFSAVSGKNISLKISNLTTAKCLLDEIRFIGNMVFADSVIVAGTDNVSEINVDNGTLQMLDTIMPQIASQDVIWSVENGTGMASISQSGLLKAIKNGTVTVKARAKDIWGTKVGKKTINLSNQIYYVDSISIKGKDGVFAINKSGDTLDIIIEAFPEAAHNKKLNITLKPVGDKVAAVFENNKLIPVCDGQVYIVAQATDGSGIKDSALFTLTNQVPLKSIAFTKQADTIKTVYGKLKLEVSFDPDTASNKSIVYSLISEGASAVITLSPNGNILPKANGKALVKVSSAVNPAIADTILIVVENYPVWKEFNVATKVDTTHISNNNDFSVKGKAAWDSKYIYLHFDVTDDSIYAVGKESTWMLDNFEIYFDMNNNKTPAWPRGQSIWPSSFDGEKGTHQLRMIPGMPFDSVNTTFKGWAVQKYEVTSSGYNFDLQITIDSLLKGYVPEVGKEIGFDVLASDNDNAPYYRDQLSIFAPLGSIWCDAALWGTVRFAPDGGFEVVNDTIKPTEAINLAATKGNKQVLLSWDAATDNIVVDKYVILVNNKPVETIYAQKTKNSYVVKNITPGDYKFGVIAEDVAGNQSAQASISYTYTGVKGLEVNSFTIYPNPSSSFISFGNESMINVKIFNAAGQMVLLKSVEPGERIDISSLKTGIYNVRIMGENSVSVLKLVKK